jgi:hypothetical protein
MVWTIDYEFSGQRAPNVAVPQPQSVVAQTDQISENVSVEGQLPLCDRVESALAQLLKERQ